MKVFFSSRVLLRNNECKADASIDRFLFSINLALCFKIFDNAGNLSYLMFFDPMLLVLAIDFIKRCTDRSCHLCFAHRVRSLTRLKDTKSFDFESKPSQ